jgi:hypothetical protein
MWSCRLTPLKTEGVVNEFNPNGGGCSGGSVPGARPM